MNRETKHSSKYKLLLLTSTFITGIIKLKSFAIIKIITYFFSKDQYAQYAFMLNTGYFLTMIAGGGVLVSLSRYLGKYVEEKNQKEIISIISTSNIIFISIIIISSLIYGMLNEAFNFVDFDNVIFLFLFAGFFSLIYGIYSILNRYNVISKKIRKYLIYYLSYELIGFAGLIVGAFVFNSILLLFGCLLIGQLISFIIIFIDWKSKLIPRKLNLSHIKKIFVFGVPKQLSDASDRLYFYIISIIILAKFSGEIYAELSLANSIVMLITFIFTNIILNYFPHISTLKSINSEESEKRILLDIKSTVELLIFISVGGFLVLVSTSKYLIFLLATPEYINAMSMVPFIIIFYCIFYLTKIMGIGLFIKEKTTLELIISVVSFIIGLTSGYLLSIPFGITGFLLSFIIFTVTRFIGITLFSYKDQKIPFDKKFLLKILIIIIVSSMEYYVFYLYDLIDYVSLIIIPSFLLLSYFLKIIKFKEIINLLKPLREYFKNKFTSKRKNQKSKIIPQNSYQENIGKKQEIAEDKINTN